MMYQYTCWIIVIPAFHELVTLVQLVHKALVCAAALYDQRFGWTLCSVLHIRIHR